MSLVSGSRNDPWIFVQPGPEELKRILQSEDEERFEKTFQEAVDLIVFDVTKKLKDISDEKITILTGEFKKHESKIKDPNLCKDFSNLREQGIQEEKVQELAKFFLCIDYCGKKNLKFSEEKKPLFDQVVKAIDSKPQQPIDIEKMKQILDGEPSVIQQCIEELVILICLNF